LVSLCLRNNGVLAQFFWSKEVIFTGNKTDREDREIPTHVGEDFAQQHDMYFLETSAKEADNVERLFMEIAGELMQVIFFLF